MTPKFRLLAAGFWLQAFEYLKKSGFYKLIERLNL
jgi:hypothetical protein